jgi:hypothetical protein
LEKKPLGKSHVKDQGVDGKKMLKFGIRDLRI